jgi:hypothetical protein
MLIASFLLVLLPAWPTWAASFTATPCRSEYPDFTNLLSAESAFSANLLDNRRHVPTSAGGGDGWLINPFGTSIVFTSARMSKVRRLPLSANITLGVAARVAAGANFSASTQILASVAPMDDRVRFFTATDSAVTELPPLYGYCGDNVAIVDQFRTGRFYLFCANSSHMVDTNVYSYTPFEFPSGPIWRPRDRAGSHLASPQLGVGHSYDLVVLAGGRSGPTVVDWVDVLWFDRTYPRGLRQERLAMSTARFDTAVSAYRVNGRSFEFLVAGGETDTGTSATVDLFVCAYNASITRFESCAASSTLIPPALSTGRGQITAIQFGLITVFAGGFDTAGNTYVEIDVFERVGDGFVARTVPWVPPGNPRGVAYVGPLNGLNLAVLTPSGMTHCAAWPFLTTHLPAADLSPMAIVKAPSLAGLNSPAFAYGALVPADERSVWVMEGMQLNRWQFPLINEGTVVVNTSLVSDLGLSYFQDAISTSRSVAASSLNWPTMRARWGSVVPGAAQYGWIGFALFNSAMADATTNQLQWVDVTEHPQRMFSYPFASLLENVKIVPGAHFVRRPGSTTLYVMGGVDYSGTANKNASLLTFDATLSTGITAQRTVTLQHPHVLGAAVQTADGLVWAAGGFDILPLYESSVLISDKVFLYNSMLLLQRSVFLSVARFSLAAVAVQNQAFFIGGATSYDYRERGYRARDMSRVVDVFSTVNNFERRTFELLHTGGLVAASAVYERFIVIVGGGHGRSDGSAGSNVIEIIDVDSGESMLMHSAPSARFSGHNAVVTSAPLVVVACTTTSTLMFDSACNPRTSSVIDLGLLNTANSNQFDALANNHVLQPDNTCIMGQNVCTSYGFKIVLPNNGAVKCKACMSIRTSMRLEMRFLLLGVVNEPQLLFRAGSVLRGQLALNSSASYTQAVASRFVPSLWLTPSGVVVKCDNGSDTLIPVTGPLPTDVNHTISIRFDLYWQRVAFNANLYYCVPPNPTKLELRERMAPQVLNSYEIGGTGDTQASVAIYQLYIAESTQLPPATVSTSSIVTLSTATTTTSTTTTMAGTPTTSEAASATTETSGSNTTMSPTTTPSTSPSTTKTSATSRPMTTSTTSSKVDNSTVSVGTSGFAMTTFAIVEVPVFPDWAYAVAVLGGLLILVLIIVIVFQAVRRRKERDNDINLADASDEMASARDDSRDSGEYGRISTIIGGGNTTYALAPNAHTTGLQQYTVGPPAAAGAAKQDYMLAPAPAIVAPDYAKAPTPATATKKRSRRAHAGAQAEVAQEYASPTVAIVEASGEYEVAPPASDTHNPYGTVLVKPYDQVRAGAPPGDYTKVGAPANDYGSSARVPLPNNYDAVTMEMKADGKDGYATRNFVPPPPPDAEDEEE